MTNSVSFSNPGLSCLEPYGSELLPVEEFTYPEIGLQFCLVHRFPITI